MKKGLIRKGLVFSVIVLFIGVVVQPVLAYESTTSLSKDDCDCEVVSKSNQYRIDRVLARLQFYIRVIQLRYRNNHEIQEMSNEILDVITSYGIVWDGICELLINFVESIKEFRDKYFDRAGYINWWLTVLSFSTYLFWRQYCPQ